MFAQEKERVRVKVSFGYHCAQERVNLEEKDGVAFITQSWVNSGFTCDPPPGTSYS